MNDTRLPLLGAGLGAGLAAALLLALAATTPAAAAQTAALALDPVQAPPDQAAEYRAPGAKSVLQLQPWRRSESAGGATLVDLAPASNSWFLLTLAAPGQPAQSYHLQNRDPANQQLRLLPDGSGIAIAGPVDEADCALAAGQPSPLEVARRSGRPYAPLCDGRLWLRNPAEGKTTQLESVTQFLRDNIWGGEQIIDLVRNTLFQDAFVESAEPGQAGGPAAAHDSGLPQPAALAPGAEGRTAAATELGIALAEGDPGRLGFGRWYPAAAAPGIAVSVMEPDLIAPAILASDGGRANRLDAVEGAALDTLVAFDLSRYTLGFALGTDHPRVGWSDRPPEAVRDPALPGPDGIGSIAPLVATGMADPGTAGSAVATFIGGFKRAHGAFRYGPLSQVNNGSHYGFVEQGVVLSKLQPGLATVYVLTDGSVGMKSWTTADDALLPRLRFARQNGVALVERDAAGTILPGALVASWGPGNWSGSAQGELRSVRGGACLQQAAGRTFLIYGFFSTATPSAMARIFQAYGCEYAMLLDMNALEHTYAAVYARRGGRLEIQHLVRGMAEVDQSAGGEPAPRFLAYPDNRDFFWVAPRSRGG
ncbi:MAG: hypothetical protein U1E53_05600 [Dongiaceae bacterium]